jgi:phosphonate transport system substrate-binding protein
MLTRRTLLHSMMTGMGVTLVGVPVAWANDWRATFPTLNFGVESRENEADRIARYKSFVAYMENTLRVPLKMHQASDYAGTIEALKARKLEFARFGPASYAQAWLITGGKVAPLVVEMDSDGLMLASSHCASGVWTPRRSASL